MPLIKGYSTTSPKRFAKARNFAGGKSCSEKDNAVRQPCLADGGDHVVPRFLGRSMPWITAPIEPEIGRTSKLFATMTARSHNLLIDIVKQA